MGEGENGSSLYTDEVNPQRAVASLKAEPLEYWQQFPYVSPVRAVEVAEAFAKGASVPVEFAVAGEYLEAAPFAADLQQLDEIEDQETERVAEVRKHIHRLLVAGNRQEASAVVKGSLPLIGSVYKVHLQPKPSDTDACVTELAKFMSDPDIHNLIYRTKVKVASDWDQGVPDTLGNVQPLIVIYPYLGRQKAQELTRKAIEHFRSLTQMGSNQAPGYNLRLSDLIFLAQADRSIKRDLASAEMIDEYFDRSTDYAFLKGEKPHWKGILPSQSPVQAVRGWFGK